MTIENNTYYSVKKALIIFVRNPVLGKVKTRLATTIGDENALIIYKALLEQTVAITKNLSLDKFVFYADFINDNDVWDNEIYTKVLQEGVDLGERMNNAFAQLSYKGYNDICIIGSDCFSLSESFIISAFDALHNKPIVVGPSTDGGYYLIGARQLNIPIFYKIDWSTAKVLEQTIKVCNNNNVVVTLLPFLTDVDEEKDIPTQLQKLLK